MRSAVCHAAAACSIDRRALSASAAASIACLSGGHAVKNFSCDALTLASPFSAESTVSSRCSTNASSSGTGTPCHRVGLPCSSTVTSRSNAFSTSSRLRPVSASATSACRVSAPCTPPSASYWAADSSPPRGTPLASCSSVKASSGNASPLSVSSTSLATRSSPTLIPASRAGPSITVRNASRRNGRTRYVRDRTEPRWGSTVQSARNSGLMVATTSTGPFSASRRSVANFAGSSVWVRSSSAWSITINSRLRRFPGTASNSSSNTSPRSSAACTSGIALSRPRSLNAAANSRTSAWCGSTPGVNTGNVNQSGSSAIRGSRPARTSEDLPHPDGPNKSNTALSARSAGERSRPASRSTSSWRPKNARCSPASNARKPGNGDRSPDQPTPPAWSMRRNASSTGTRAASTSA